LKFASFSYNTSVHEGTRYTPFELVFGKIANSDSSLDSELNETYFQYLTTLFDKLRDVQTIAYENLIQAKLRSKRYYDRKISPRKYNVGDLVYMLKGPIKNKLADRYVGPYKIIDILENNNVKLEISSNKTRVVHIDKLKLDLSNNPTIAEDPHHAIRTQARSSGETVVSERSPSDPLRI